MAKVRNLEEAVEKFGGGGGGGFFSLKDHKDTAVVRFAIGDELIPDEDWFIVHEVEIDGKTRNVNCTQEGDCYGCKTLGKPRLKLFLQLEDDREPGVLKIWERGKTFVSKITGLQNKYGPLHNRQYEIERNGKKGDTGTTYEVYPMDKDNFELADMPERQAFMSELDGNGLVLNLSNRIMQQAINGSWTPPKGGDGSTGNRNDREERGSRRSDPGPSDSDAPPATSRRNRPSEEDVF